MSSSNRIDYSLRQNKAIERGIVFDGLRMIVDRVGTAAGAVYVGFGSVWFTDFHLAHRLLGVREMVSMENDPVTAKRAEFNKPYRTIVVRAGDSVDLIPELLAEDGMRARPWISWLDFDKSLNEDRLQQLDDLVQNMPPNSFLITTFSATAGQYGNPAHRVARLDDLFGFAMPSVTTEDVRDEVGLGGVLARALLDRLVALSVQAGRPPAIPCFRLCYRDGAMMVTIGIFLPDEKSEGLVRDVVRAENWCGIVEDPVTTPPLTPREVTALRALLPADSSLTRDDVLACGFDLEDDQISLFSKYYLRFPIFAQLAL